MSEEEIYNKIKEDFNCKFTKYVSPLLKDAERERFWMFIASVLSKWTIISAGVILIIMSRLIFVPYVIIGITLLYCGNIAGKVIKKNFELKIKRKIMPAVCSCFPDLKWMEPQKITKFWELVGSVYGFDIVLGSSAASENINNYGLYRDSGLISTYTVLRDDCFEGEYKGIKFFIEENRSDSMPKHPFNGAFITFDMNKNFKGNTVINGFPSSRLHHTILEDVEFEKKFNVHTDDDVEARYLITPSLMERLKSMQVAFKADRFSASFYQNKFLIAFYIKKDLFSIENSCKKEQFFIMFEEILSIIKLIDHFKLNEKTGL